MDMVTEELLVLEKLLFQMHLHPIQPTYQLFTPPMLRDMNFNSREQVKRRFVVELMEGLF